MGLFRALRSNQFYTFLRHENTSLLVRNSLCSYSFPDFQKWGPRSRSSSFLVSSIFRRTLSVSPQVEERTEAESTDSDKDELTKKSVKRLEKKIKEIKRKKPLDLISKGDVGLYEKLEESEFSEEELKEGDFSSDLTPKGIKEVKKLKRNVRSVKGDVKDTEKQKKTLKEDEVPKDQSKPKSLYALFTNKSGYGKKSGAFKRERISSYGESESVKKDSPHHREFSPEMVSLASRLHKEEYLNDANFWPQRELDISSFSNNYSRGFLRFAAERFGRDHQEIANVQLQHALDSVAIKFNIWHCRWLSGSDLKKVALFGCPSVEKKIVFAAKRLRAFFHIQEDTVCRTCKLKESCKLMNKRVWKVDNNLNLADVMRVLTVYDLESLPPQLVVPNEMKASISRLLNEVLNLTQ
ncbi:hypothetical protein HHK36_005187 [Tetracentron sinense]|uniref:Uncharacterized protein n=1 Tax=Tetracentron sinense TaxID=13715 RepID=A0A835DQH8_TETSI|nr:hypothetical protein HHK36_005187 [Tetracentron sinense]